MRKNCMFEASKEGEILELTLRGEIDHHSAVAIRTEMDAKILEEKPKKTVLNLSGIEFMDSSGLGLIMGRYALVKQYGGILSLLDPSYAVIKILRLAGMDRTIPIKKTKEMKR